MFAYRPFPARFLGGCAFVCMLLTACAPSPKTISRPTPNWPHQARELYQAGKYEEAARSYQKAARGANPNHRPVYLLRAADAWLRADRLEQARDVLERIDRNRLPSAEQAFFHLLRAQIALHNGEPTLSLSFLAPINPRRIPAPLHKRYLALKARAHTLQGDLEASVRERVRLGALANTPHEVEDNNRAILEALLLIPEEGLDRLQNSAGHDLAGWIELIRILRSHPYLSNALEQELARWRHQYPSHPATANRFLENYLATRLPTYQAPHKIALFLPATGPYRMAAEAIDLGIEALRNLPSIPDQPELVHYDTSVSDAISLYREARRQGAGLILGPLQKSNLEQLSRLEHFNPPVLALNQIEGLSRQRLFQIALAPEEAVEQTANSAWLHGHQRALLLVPATPLGHRIEQHFQDYWNHLGGRVLEIQYYDPSATDFSTPLKQLLDIDESRYRFQRLRKVLWEIQFEPRVRHDADFVFLQAGPRQGRLIRPQLKFYKAGYLPVYASRDIYEGHPNPGWDKDMDGIRFCDIPWLLDGEFETAPSVADFEEAFGPHSGAYLRLAALGMDAYRIPFTLLGTGDRYAGVTGILHPGNDGRILRQTTCAEFRRGIPVIYGLSPDVVAVGMNGTEADEDIPPP